MPISAIHSYLVHPPSQDGSVPRIGGTSIRLNGRLFQMLEDIYDKSDDECTIDISFNHDDQGAQQNDCRDLLTDYLRNPNVGNGRPVAERLQSVSTNRSGLGLLFTLAGKEGRDHKLVVSRFPADSGILAEEDESSLSVEFLEKVFLKSATSYKAVVYRGTSINNHFWDGLVIDKQINNSTLAISQYWINEFLSSDFKTTSAAGTRRLADTLREGVRDAVDLSVKEELVAASRLASNLDGRSTSIRAFANKYSLSDAAQRILRDRLPSDKLYTEQFTFTRDEFDKIVAWHSVELDNGGILTAGAQDFEDVFKTEELDGDQLRYITEGSVVNQKLKKSRSL